MRRILINKQTVKESRKAAIIMKGSIFSKHAEAFEVGEHPFELS